MRPLGSSTSVSSNAASSASSVANWAHFFSRAPKANGLPVCESIIQVEGPKLANAFSRTLDVTLLVANIAWTLQSLEKERQNLVGGFWVTYKKIGTIQRRLAWPLHKHDTFSRSGKPTGLNVYFVHFIHKLLISCWLCVRSFWVWRSIQLN